MRNEELSEKVVFLRGFALDLNTQYLCHKDR